MQNEQATPSFRTLAFIDLETTGLLGLDATRTKITEISIIACAVHHILDLEESNATPRVHHKLTLCFNPRKLIKLDCTEVTGLTNELLENERKFDENAVDLINNFLNHLQQPVCLVAHNGNRFDYPLLKSHCKLLNKSLPESLICCDSLVIFRKIDEIYDQNSKTLINGFRLTSWENIKSQQILMMDAEILEIEELARNYESDEEDINVTMTVSQLEGEFINSDIEVMIKNETSIEDFNDMNQQINEITPNKPIKTEQKIIPSKSDSSNKRVLNGTRRQLFPQSSEQPKISKNGKKIWPKGHYTLREIYKRFFDEYPENSHDAESDVKSLLKCVCACKKEFLDVAMKTAYNFCDVKNA